MQNQAAFLWLQKAWMKEKDEIKVGSQEMAMMGKFRGICY